MPDNLKGSEGKPFLTPLVTYLEDTQTGADIDLAVNRVLSPLKRKVLLPLTKLNDNEENGSASDTTEESTSNCGSQPETGKQSMNYSDLEEMSSKDLSFRLCIADDRGSKCKPIARETPIKPSSIVKVMMGWTDREQQLYDASYLKDLPEVHKMGPMVKKTRQDSITLFQCLDAFLKEEPLGPDDMWWDI